MDKKTAILTLTEILAQEGNFNVVHNSVIQSQILSEAKNSVLNLSDGFNHMFMILSDLKYYSSEFSFSENSKEKLLAFRDKVYGANYFFTQVHFKTHRPDDYRGFNHRIYISATPVAIIGETEERILRNRFYKKVQTDVKDAMDILNIKNFISFFEKYSSFNVGEDSRLSLLPFFDCFRSFTDCDEIRLGDVIWEKKKGTYVVVRQVHRDLILGDSFENENDIYEGFKCRENYRVYKEHMVPWKKRILGSDLEDFLLNLPLNDHNLRADQFLIKRASIYFLKDFFSKLYLKDFHFKEYFLALDNKKVQEEIVQKVLSLDNQNLGINRWLSIQGFEVGIDIVEIYESNPPLFKILFKRYSEKNQKQIIEDIFELNYENPEIVGWLDENYHHLLKSLAYE